MKLIKFLLKSFFIGLILLIVIDSYFDGKIVGKNSELNSGFSLILIIALGSLTVFLYRKIFKKGSLLESNPTESNQSTLKEKRKSSGMFDSASKALAATAAYNAVTPPIVIPLNGATVHGVTPKGMYEWEIIFSVPGNTLVQRERIKRGSTGFTYGTYRFEVRWSNPLS